MALIDLDDLKQALGVGDIYANALLQQVADAAEDLLLPYLARNKVTVVGVELVSNTARIYFNGDHRQIVVGDNWHGYGLGSTFDGSKTVTKVTSTFYEFAKTHADQDFTAVWPYGYAIHSTSQDIYDTDERARQAALMVAVDIWQARLSASGQLMGADFQPGPYRMGRSLLSRVMGLIGPIRDPRGMVG